MSLHLEVGVYITFDLLAHGLHGLPLGVLVGAVMEAVGHGHAVMVRDIVLARVLERHRGEDGVIVADVDGVERVGGGDHFLVEFLAGAYADLHLRQRGGDGRGHVGDVVGGNLRDEDLAAEMVADRPEHEVDARFERDVESRHAHVGDGQLGGSGVAAGDEEGDHAAARAHHVAVSHHAELHRVVALDVVGGREEFVAGELGCAVEVDRGAGLVGREGHDVLHARGEGGVDDVLGAVHIGLDAFLGIVFGGVDLLDGRGVDDHVDALAGADQTFAVAHVADEESQLGILVVGVFLLELELLEFVARVNHDALHVGIPAQDDLDEFLAERACAARDEY